MENQRTAHRTAPLPHNQRSEESEPMRRQRRKTMTDKMVAALPKRRRRYIVSDPEQRGLYVRIPPSGPNVYAVVARNRYKKQVWHTVGSADVMGIDEARELTRSAIKRIKAGLPPVEAPPTPPDAFKKVAEDWLKRHVVKEKLRTKVEIERCLRIYVLPHLGERSFTDIRRSDITALLDHIEDKHGSRQADIVLGIVRRIANWYATRHDDYLSPFVRGMGRHKNAARSHTLNDDELRRVWKQAEASGSFGAMIRTLLLTAQRRGAVLHMRWDDVSADGVWEIPTEAREKGNAGTLKLPAQALAIINAQPKLSSNPFVFAASRGDGPLNGFSRAKRTFDKRCGVAGWTLHDLRRTARTLMSRAEVRSDIAERVLGHVIAGVEGVYDRHRYDNEKADALLRLAALIDTILNPPTGNVRQFRKAAKS
jgi:integrase